MSDLKNFRTVVLNFNANGDNTAITAVTGRIISVYKIWFTVAGAVNVTFYNGLAGTALSGPIVLSGSGSSFMLYYDGSPHFVTSPGAAFNVNLSGAIALTGEAYYLLG